MADSTTSIWDVIPAALTVLGTGTGIGMNLAGGALSKEGATAAGDAAVKAGQRQRQLDEFQAAQLEGQSSTSIAVAQRAAEEQRRQGEVAKGRILALAAASGGGTGGSVATIIARTAGQTTYNMNTLLYQGEETARQQKLAATAKRFEGFVADESGLAQKNAWDISGQAAEQKAKVAALNNGLTGLGALAGLGKAASSLLGNYGGSGPPAPVSDAIVIPAGDSGARDVMAPTTDAASSEDAMAGLPVDDSAAAAEDAANGAPIDGATVNFDVQTLSDPAPVYTDNVDYSQFDTSSDYGITDSFDFGSLFEYF